MRINRRAARGRSISVSAQGEYRRAAGGWTISDEAFLEEARRIRAGLAASQRVAQVLIRYLLAEAAV
jgi:hypothetical protein